MELSVRKPFLDLHFFCGPQRSPLALGVAGSLVLAGWLISMRWFHMLNILGENGKVQFLCRSSTTVLETGLILAIIISASRLWRKNRVAAVLSTNKWFLL